MKKTHVYTTPVIAVVDDDRDDLLIIEEAFASGPSSVKVQCYASPSELKEHLHGNPTPDDKPSLIILDLYSAGETTLDFIRRLKSSSYDSIPVVMMSGSSVQDHVRQFYKVGGSSFIVKPVSFDQWQVVVQLLCRYWFEIVVLPEHRYN